MRVDVIYAAHLKPGDLYAGRVDTDAPTTPVQPIAAAIPVRDISVGHDETGRKIVRLNPNILGLSDYTPIPYSMQVLVIRGNGQ